MELIGIGNASSNTVMPLSPYDWWTISFSLAMAALATAIILPPGIFLGWLLARKQWAGKAIVETLVTLPLVMPPVAVGLILLKTFGRRGSLGKFLDDHLGMEIIFTWRAVVIAMAVMAFPLMVRGARISFEGVNRRLEQVAATLGASPLRIFFTITFPLALRGILGGGILSFARALGEFGATILVAGNIPWKTSTLSISIYNDIQFGHDGHAFMLLIFAATFAFCAIFISEWLFKPKAS